MINLNGSVLRNLEEQVQYLTEQLNALKTLNLNGLTIVGNVNDVEDIPEEYTGNVGDCYIVVNAPQPNDLYMYGDIGNGTLGWLYLGPYPARGPQGNNGLKGPKGDTGESTKWYTGINFPASAKFGDMFLKTDTFQVYRFDEDIGWTSKCNIKGLAGTDGLNGNSIISISTTRTTNATKVIITTSNGGTVNFNVPDGEPGAGFHIAHIYPQNDADIEDTLADYLTGTAYDSIEALLNSIWPSANANPADAILVKTNDEGDYMFVIINSNNTQVWDNVGQIESVQGPAGEDGTQITSNEQIEVHAIDATHNDLNILSLPYLTTAPSAAYTPIGNSLKLVVLSSEPATYYSGYYYIITEE